MERSYLLGGLLTLIAVGVLIIIIVSIFPGFGEEVKQIADDVFGIPGSGESIKQQNEDRTKSLMKSISKAIECAANKETADTDGCICQIENEEMPENYYIELLQEEDGTYILKSYNPSGKLLDDMPLLSKIQKLYYKLKLDSLEADGILGGGKFYYEDNKLMLEIGRNKGPLSPLTPIFVNEKNQIIFLFDNEEYDQSVLNKIQTQNICQTRESSPITQQAIEHFNKFTTSYETCITTEAPIGKVYCQCRQISIIEPSLPQAFEIKINPKKTGEKWATTFALTTEADGKIVTDSENKPLIKTINKFFQEEEKPLDAQTKKPEPQYIYFNQENKLQKKYDKWVFIKYMPEAGKSGADPKAEASGIIFSPADRSEDKGIPHCLGVSQTISPKGCTTYDIKYYSECGRSFRSEIEIWNRISKGTDNQKTPLGNTYLQVMAKNGLDECNQYLLSGIIASESNGKNTDSNGNIKTSPTGCKGLMQFCGPSAKEVGLCSSSKCLSETDKRGEPELAIPAGWKLLQQKKSYLKNECESGLDISGVLDLLAVASYNGGEGVMCKAIKKLGKDNPSWDELRTVINSDLLETISTYREGYFDSDKKREAKAKEIRCYPYYAYQYRDRFEKLDLN